MIFDYQGPLDVPAYYIATPRGAYMLTAGPNRPAGPVVFTSTARLDAFLRYHRSRWGAIEGACAARLPIRLGEYRAQLAESSAAAGLLLYVDPRPPVLPAADLDADSLRLL